MKNLAILCFLFIFALTAFGQPPKTTSKKLPRTVKTVAPKLGTETEEFEKAKAISDPAQRLAALQAFIKNFPESTETARAQGLIVGARAELADKKLEAGETEAGIELFKLAVQEAPAPVSDELFTKVILGFPISLYSRNQRGAAFDVVKLIEEKVGANASQILDLAKFYINIQYGTEAIRLAKKSTELAPDSATGYLTLAIANRLNFQLEDAANAYAKAAELDAESVTNKRSLADMKRALGKTDEAIAIYRQLLEKDATDAATQTGLILALFDADKVKEAETELAKALETNPNNAPLLTGAAYWYAAHNKGEKAVDYAQRAIAADRNSVWSYIAQARGLLAQKKPLEAEKILLAARQFGDFPTLDYELASARLAAGLYREAAETLKRNFALNKDGALETYLGNRILADAGSFTELLSLERRVALFETKAADSEENTSQLKALLAFYQKLEAKEATEDELRLAAQEFAAGGDNMRLHRQLFAASRLLQKKTALPKVLDLMQSAIDGVDAALNVASPAAAVLADEIYESRQYAISQNLVIVVPEISRPTLSAILRGQIEDIAGRALFQQNNVSQSVIRLKRALSVLPEKSAFSRASAWHLGEALQAEGKDQEALDAYIKGYNKDFPELGKRTVIENLYAKVNGSLDGLDEKVGARPDTTVATSEIKPPVNNTDNVKITEPTPAAETKTEVPAAPTEVKSEPTPAPSPETTPESKPETKIEPSPLPESVPSVAPEKTPEATPEVTPSPSPANVETDPAKNEPAPVETKPAEEEKTEPPKTDEVKSNEAETDEVKADPVTSPTPAETPATEPQPTPENKPVPTETEETKPEEKQPPANTVETEPEETKPAETKPIENKPAIRTQPSPAPPSMAVIVTDNLSSNASKSKPEEPKIENKPPAASQNTTKSIFEPVVISIGKTDSSNPEKTSPNKPLEEKPAEPKQTEVKLTEVKSPEEKPVEDKPVEDKPVDEKSLEEKSLEEKSVEEKPAEDTPAEDTPAEDKSVEEKPVADNTVEDKSVEEKPLEEKPVVDKKPANRTSLATVKKPEVVVTDTLKPANRTVEDAQKSVADPTPVARTENESPFEKRAERINTPQVVVTDLLKPENKPVEKTTDEKILSGESRARIIITENTGPKTVTREISGCQLITSLDSLALLNGGGALGVSVSFDGAGDFRRISAVSSSAEDVEVKFDPEIGARQNRAFFIVRSISTRTGVYTVTFEAPCGRKEILVKVR